MEDSVTQQIAKVLHSKTQNEEFKWSPAEDNKGWLVYTTCIWLTFVQCAYKCSSFTFWSCSWPRSWLRSAKFHTLCCQIPHYLGPLSYLSIGPWPCPCQSSLLHRPNFSEQWCNPSAAAKSWVFGMRLMAIMAMIMDQGSMVMVTILPLCPMIMVLIMGQGNKVWTTFVSWKKRKKEKKTTCSMLIYVQFFITYLHSILKCDALLNPNGAHLIHGSIWAALIYYSQWRLISIATNMQVLVSIKRKVIQYIKLTK